MLIIILMSSKMCAVIISITAIHYSLTTIQILLGCLSNYQLINSTCSGGGSLPIVTRGGGGGGGGGGGIEG